MQAPIALDVNFEEWASMTPQSLSAAKAEAKALRTRRAAEGRPITQAEALEHIARASGLRDWNTLCAKLASTAGPTLAAQTRVKGQYLGVDFSGQIISTSGNPEALKIAIQLDTPIDTVRFESFSNMRSRLHATIGPDGRSTEKTSDGIPHLILELPTPATLSETP